MSQKSQKFQRQYQDALVELEDEDTEIFLFAAGKPNGKTSIVMGNNTAVDTPHDHLDLLATEISLFAQQMGVDEADVLGRLGARLREVDG